MDGIVSSLEQLQIMKTGTVLMDQSHHVYLLVEGGGARCQCGDHLDLDVLWAERDGELSVVVQG